MRIEKINEHQIRCTLYQKDLKDREIRISELAYGTEKARAFSRYDAASVLRIWI